MKNFDEIGNLACFMIEAIANCPENRDENGVNWNYVSADVYFDYKGNFDNDMINDAIDLIYEAANLPVLH